MFGTFCILAVNSWMNAPSGFDLVVDASGTLRATDVDPLAAIFNGALWPQFVHMFVATYLVTGFLAASVYAVGILRGRRDHAHRLGFIVPFAFATVAALVQPVIGHVAGMRLATEQPSKLAAMELAVETETNSPLIIGGVLIDGEVRGGIEIPSVGSLLARASTDRAVPGLNEFPVEDRPPANVVHLSFQTMVASGFAMIGIALWFWWKRRRSDPFESRWLMRAAVVAGGLSVVALEAGWITTEVGRQPWIVYRVMRVEDAVTENSGIWISLTAIVVIYTAMSVAAVAVLRSMARRWRESADDRPPHPVRSAGPHGRLPTRRRPRSELNGVVVSLSDVVAVLMFVGVVAYALFGGADFGSGLWDLLAGGDEAGGALRAQIDRSLGPVWEANHVWLIYILVFMWTAFPTAFSALMTTLFVPWLLAGFGIVLRGATFAFRKFSATLGEARLYGVVFASSSLITPFFLGMIAGAVASGRVPADGYGDRWTSWTGPTSWLGGTLAVLTCSFLAGTFLAADFARAGHDDMAAAMGRRALVAGAITGAVALGAVLVLEADAESLADGLQGRGAAAGRGLGRRRTVQPVAPARRAVCPGTGRCGDRGRRDRHRLGRRSVPGSARRRDDHCRSGRRPVDVDRADHRVRAGVGDGGAGVVVAVLARQPAEVGNGPVTRGRVLNDAQCGQTSNDAVNPFGTGRRRSCPDDVHVSAG